MKRSASQERKHLGLVLCSTVQSTQFFQSTVTSTLIILLFVGSALQTLTIIGSIFSGVFTDPIGRKKAMLFVNIPCLAGWFVLYFATSLTQVFIGMSLLGLGVGLMEAPIVTYVGEIWLVDLLLFMYQCASTKIIFFGLLVKPLFVMLWCLRQVYRQLLDFSWFFSLALISIGEPFLYCVQ